MSAFSSAPSTTAANKDGSGHRGISAGSIWLAAALVVVANGGILVFQWSRVPVVRQPKVPLQDQVIQSSALKSQNVQSPPERVLAVGADQMVEHQYEYEGSTVFAHRASWTSLDEWLPHEPDICYTSQGWRIASQSTVALPQHPEANVALRSYEQAGRRLWVVFWYQIGTLTYCDRDGARPARRAYWGERERPPLIKTVLQTLDDDPSGKKLLALAAVIYEANGQL
jgi:Protein of unknown function (DUF3485)